jgi:hypothetical protein
LLLHQFDDASIIVTLIIVMQQQHFPPCLYSSCYYNYCVSKDKTTKREVKRREGESEKEKRLKGNGVVANGKALLVAYVLLIFLFISSRTKHLVAYFGYKSPICQGSCLLGML